MGYSDSTFDFVLNHKEEGFLSKGSKIMELGAQEINTDVSVLKIIDFGLYVNHVFPNNLRFLVMYKYYTKDL
jgi:hypothetical protein